MYLKYDPASLSVCSLVSRSWHIESRRIFFHKLTIEVDEVKHYRLRLRPYMKHTTGTESFVREFHLYSPYFNIGNSTDVSVRLSTLGRVLVRFPSLEAVRISFTSWDLHPGANRFWDRVLPRSSISLPSVKRVTIIQSYGVPRASSETLYPLLCWFPALEELEVLRGITLHRSLVPNDHPLPELYYQLLVENSSPTAAKRNATPESNPLDPVSTSLAAPELHTLAIDMWTNADLISVKGILLDRGAWLRHLIIRMPPQWEIYKGLSSLPQLSVHMLIRYD